jgi:hypothetical protein
MKTFDAYFTPVWGIPMLKFNVLLHRKWFTKSFVAIWTHRTIVMILLCFHFLQLLLIVYRELIPVLDTEFTIIMV